MANTEKDVKDIKARPWPGIIPRLRPLRSTLTWRLGSRFVLPAIALTSKIWMTWLNTFRIKNHQVFLDEVERHYQDRSYPLLTISNHASCCDDPGLWGALYPWTWLPVAGRHRWSAAAEDICFTKHWHTLFFSLGKTFPVVRGLGINQQGMDFAVDLVKEHQFLHIFPQGRVVEDPDLNLDMEAIRKLPLEEQLKKVTLRDGDFDKSYQLKWGLARIILEYLRDANKMSNQREPFIQVLPFFHIGMDHILPNVEPYVPRIGNLVTVFIRKEGPIRFDTRFITEEICNGQILSTKETRSKIMAYLERELKLLKLNAIEFRRSIINPVV